MIPSRTPLALALLVLLFAATPVLGATITVTTSADGSFPALCTLRDAVASANTDTAVGGCTAGSGMDQIVFDSTVFKVETTFLITNGSIAITESVTIDGADLVIVDATGNSRVFSVASGTATLLNMRLTNGVADRGGLIFVAGGATLEADGLTADNGVANGNPADNGGGALYLDLGSAIIMNSTFDNNAATGVSGSGGSILNKRGSLIMTGSTVSNSTANRAGGGIEDAGGTTFLTDVTLSGNDGGANPGNGGGLHTGGGMVTVEGGSVMGNTAVEGAGLWSSGTLTVRPNATDSGTLIDGNEAIGDADEAFEGGGGLFNQGGTMTVTGATISNNSATGPGGSGGGAFNNAGASGASFTITGTLFAGNTAMRAGGGMEVNGGTVSLTSTDFDTNDAGDSPGNGGALHVTKGTVTATGGKVTSNTATEGGGFWNNAGWTMTLTDVTFMANATDGEAADHGGGALFNNGGDMDITGGMISGNTASTGSASGGGLLTTDGAVSISGTTFSMNSANRAGGAIEIIDGDVDIEDTDFDQNDAGDAPGNGGAIHVTGEATIDITGGEVTDNVATREGGGFWNQAGSTMNVEGTSFTGNTANGPAADDGGGALFNNGGVLNVTDSEIAENTATGASGSGGGVLNLGGVFVMSGGVVRDNTANRAGGGIEDAGGTVLLSDVVVANNSIDVAAPGNGGGLHSGGGTVTIQGGSIFGNTAVEGGGVWVKGALTIQNGVDGEMVGITGNEATGDDATNGGGGVYLEAGSEATITMAAIDGNSATGTAGSGGGLLVADGSEVEVIGGSISGNTANRAGGGIEVNNDSETDAVAILTLDGVMVNNNSIDVAAPGNGGGLHSGGGDVEIYGGMFSGNTATEGGAIWVNAGLLIDRDDADAATMIMGNEGTGDDATNGGGGVYAESGADAEIYWAKIMNNSASGTSGSGGGVFVADAASVLMEWGMVSGNTANRAGGGFEVADDPSTAENDDDVASLFVSKVTVDGNSIDVAAPGNGGGLHVGGIGVAVIERSTFSNNTAREGAGLWISGGGGLDLSLSTVSGNESTDDGGGIYDQGDGGEMVVSGVTVADNVAGGSGGGLFSSSSDGSTFTLGNVLVSGNTGATGPDCAGMFASDGPNLVEDLSICTVAGDVISDQDPLLMGLADNGGMTQTHALMSGSPAIDAGDSDFGIDQRGFEISGAADIGSYEFGGGTVACSVTSQVGLRMLMPGSMMSADESVVIFNADTMNGVDLSGCDLVAFDAFTGQITYVLDLDQNIGMDGSLTASTSGGDITIPAMSFPDEFGAILLVNADVSVGDMPEGDDFDDVVAAIVYRNGATITDTFVGGADNDDERENFVNAIAALVIATDVDGPSEDVTVDLDVFAAPNPAVNATTIRFGLEQSAAVRVTLFDVLGREVATLADATYERGRHDAALDASGLSAGMYLVRVDVEGEPARTARVTVVR